MRAAIYCRVSTEDQEREGTSLRSQREACEKLAKEHGYDVPDGFSYVETYSGLILERPKLNELRETIRDGAIDVVIAYALDRVSRDPVHFILLQEEMERSGIDLQLVTEDVDTSDMGKLIAHIRGFSAKLEVEKIKERTMRGQKQRAKAGRFPSGWRGRLFGYDYIPGKGVGEGVRNINEEQTEWVRQIYNWYVTENIGIERIAFRLNELGVPTPSGGSLWNVSTVWSILQNRNYIGETFAFTQTRGNLPKSSNRSTKTRTKKVIKKPREEWIEIPDATPPIIDLHLFDLAQIKLKRNKERASRNKKHQYLLSGHVKCQRCGRPYWGYLSRGKWKDTIYLKRYYRCAGKLRRISPGQCDNRNINADEIEELIWQEVDKIMSHPQMVLSELERRKHDPNQETRLAKELQQIDNRLRVLDRDQEGLLQWALRGFPEETVVKENEKINRERSRLKDRRSDLEKLLVEAKQHQFEIDDIERCCELIRNNMKHCTYEEMRLVLEALQLEIWVDGNEVSLNGSIPISIDGIVSSRVQYTR